MYKKNSGYNGGNASIDHDQILAWQDWVNNQPQGVSDRTYYKDLNFSSLKQFQQEVTKMYNTLEHLLIVKPNTRDDLAELIMLRVACFRRIEKMVDLLSFDWLENTASFSGSSEERQKAYETILDEIKASISACSPPTKVDNLQIFMKHFKHFGKWLLSESLNYSIGERTDSTDPQRFKLEGEKIRGSAGIDAANQGQNRISRTLSSIIPFRKNKPPEGEGPPHKQSR